MDIPTLQQFAQFLYRLPQNTIQNEHNQSHRTETMHFSRSKCMWTSPLCSNLLNFYTVSHKTRYKISVTKATAQNPYIFLRSKCMMRSPLCGRFHNFHTVSHKSRYKIRLIRATAQNAYILWVKVDVRVLVGHHGQIAS